MANWHRRAPPPTGHRRCAQTQERRQQIATCCRRVAIKFSGALSILRRRRRAPQQTSPADNEESERERERPTRELNHVQQTLGEQCCGPPALLMDGHASGSCSRPQQRRRRPGQAVATPPRSLARPLHWAPRRGRRAGRRAAGRRRAAPNISARDRIELGRILAPPFRDEFQRERVRVTAVGARD